MQLKIKKLKDGAKLPTYAHAGDVGLDLYSMEAKTLAPGEQFRFDHGFALEFPEGYGAFVVDKGSVSKAGLKTVGGVFDAGYRGEYNTQIINLGKEPYTVEAGDKVSQLVIMPVEIATLEEAETLSDSSRGEGRFGSTGKK